MHRTPGSADYHSNLQTFLHILSEAQMKAHADDNTVKAIGVYHETGRKFDKVFIATINQKDKSAPAVRYFIRRTDGSIFGAKSPVAPNLKWYFGNVYEADLWDWSGYHGVPLDFDAETGESKAAGVKAAGAYGEYQHFEPSDPARARALAKA